MTAAFVDLLVPGVRYFYQDGTVTPEFMLLWQNMWDRQQTTDAAQDDLIAAIAAAQGAADAADAAAAAAQTAADTANDAAAEIVTGAELTGSYIDPLTALSAADTGIITIASHDRVYAAGGGTVAVTGNTISGFSPGDYVNVYYSDPTRAGGAVTFQGTTGLISQEGDTHIVGGVAIPTLGDPPADGYGGFPPGFIPPYWVP